MRLSVSAIGLILLLFVSGGCSKVTVPLGLSTTPTSLPTPVPLPTKIAFAAPTPTLVLLSTGDTSEAATMLGDFSNAVATGDLEGAQSYWNTSQPGQPSGYDANVRKMVQDWIDKKQRLVVGTIIYSGLDGTGKSVSMPSSDLRVEKATAKVSVGGVEYQFYLTLLKGGWFIQGVNTFTK